VFFWTKCFTLMGSLATGSFQWCVQGAKLGP
jgi:hypothetical protein